MAIPEISHQTDSTNYNTNCSTIHQNAGDRITQPNSPLGATVNLFRTDPDTHGNIEQRRSLDDRLDSFFMNDLENNPLNPFFINQNTNEDTEQQSGSLDTTLNPLSMNQNTNENIEQQNYLDTKQNSSSINQNTNGNIEQQSGTELNTLDSNFIEKNTNENPEEQNGLEDNLFDDLFFIDQNTNEITEQQSDPVDDFVKDYLMKNDIDGISKQPSASTNNITDTSTIQQNINCSMNTMKTSTIQQNINCSMNNSMETSKIQQNIDFPMSNTINTSIIQQNNSTMGQKTDTTSNMKIGGQVSTILQKQTSSIKQHDKKKEMFVTVHGKKIKVVKPKGNIKIIRPVGNNVFKVINGLNNITQSNGLYNIIQPTKLIRSIQPSNITRIIQHNKSQEGSIQSDSNDSRINDIIQSNGTNDLQSNGDDTEIIHNNEFNNEYEQGNGYNNDYVRIKGYNNGVLQPNKNLSRKRSLSSSETLSSGPSSPTLVDRQILKPTSSNKFEIIRSQDIMNLTELDHTENEQEDYSKYKIVNYGASSSGINSPVDSPMNSPENSPPPMLQNISQPRLRIISTPNTIPRFVTPSLPQRRVNEIPEPNVVVISEDILRMGSRGLGVPLDTASDNMVKQILEHTCTEANPVHRKYIFNKLYSTIMKGVENSSCPLPKKVVRMAGQDVSEELFRMAEEKKKQTQRNTTQKRGPIGVRASRPVNNRNNAARPMTVIKIKPLLGTSVTSNQAVTGNVTKILNPVQPGPSGLKKNGQLSYVTVSNNGTSNISVPKIPDNSNSFKKPEPIFKSSTTSMPNLSDNFGTSSGNGLPQITNRPPQITNGLPQITNGLPQKPNGLSQKPNGLPQKTKGLPQKTNGLPQITNGLPQITNGLPQITNGLPQVTDGISSVVTQNASIGNKVLCQKRSMMMLYEGDNDNMELGVAETYAQYKPAKLKIGREHPDPVVETASMSSVPPVDVTYQLIIPEDIIDQGILSAVQLESITYASQIHERLLPLGERCGFLIGDGPGVGKGRTIAGLVYENFLRGRKRCLWVSASSDLEHDARRDLRDIGADIPVFSLGKLKYGYKASAPENGGHKRGVMYSTYASLLGESNSAKGRREIEDSDDDDDDIIESKRRKKSNTAKGEYSTRLQQIQRWCGSDFEGLLIFDECHKAKNLCANGTKSKTGQMVLELQNRFPSARVLYVSATGASEPKHMAYMTRLGLWGPGTTFKTFDDFAQTVEDKGVGGMEIVAMDMKLRGMYIARQLSFKNVEFSIEKVSLDAKTIKLHESCTKLWTELLYMYTEGADLIALGHHQRKIMFGQLWSSHQRFFKNFCQSVKVEPLVKLVKEAISNNCSVVIGLQTTGEAATLDTIDKTDGELTDFVSGCRVILENLVENYFPTPDRETLKKISERARTQSAPSWKEKLENEKRALNQMDRDKEEDSSDSDLEWDTDKRDRIEEAKRRKIREQIRLEEERNTNATLDFFLKKKKHLFDMPEVEKKKEEPAEKVPTMEDVQRVADMKERLKNKINILGPKLPINALDAIIDQLGGPKNVAEMTGRKGRMIRCEDGTIKYVRRSNDDVAMDMLNVKEKERFMDGEKNVAIISDAASSGISLHSDSRAKNQKQRIHITLELPWSADKAVQQFGRTHRSNQVTPPKYILLITEIAGEKRFASTVAKRLESLGALTHGDRRASGSLSQFNIDNKYAKAALDNIMKAILKKESPLLPEPEKEFFHKAIKALTSVGLIITDNKGNRSFDKEYNNISKFLNRILGIKFSFQNKLFKYFETTMNKYILMAKKDDTFDLGILDIDADDTRIVKRIRTMTYTYKYATGPAPINLHEIGIEAGMSWEKAIQLYSTKNIEQHNGFYKSHQSMNEKYYVMLLLEDDKIKKKFTLYKPNTGKQNKPMVLSEIHQRYKKVTPDDVQALWIEQYEFESCSHVYWRQPCGNAKTCKHGVRKTKLNVMAGSFMSIWKTVENVIVETNKNGTKKKVQMLRLRTKEGVRIVGHLIQDHLVDGLMDVLGTGASKTRNITY